MVERVAGVGYLAQVEANTVGVRAGADVVYIRLCRDFSEEGQTTSMFAEISPGDALALSRNLDAAARTALACITPF